MPRAPQTRQHPWSVPWQGRQPSRSSKRRESQEHGYPIETWSNPGDEASRIERITAWKLLYSRTNFSQIAPLTRGRALGRSCEAGFAPCPTSRLVLAFCQWQRTDSVHRRAWTSRMDPFDVLAMIVLVHAHRRVASATSCSRKLTVPLSHYPASESVVRSLTCRYIPSSLP